MLKLYKSYTPILSYLNGDPYELENPEYGYYITQRKLELQLLATGTRQELEAITEILKTNESTK